MRQRWSSVLLGSVLILGCGWTGLQCAAAQTTARVQPQETAEDVLGVIVQASATIFAGEVYAIRMPQGESNVGTTGGLHSSHEDVVDVEFRVDQGVRGTSIGNNYVLRMPLATWRLGPPPFALHQRSMNFLKPADASGLTEPVQAEADLPGMDVGVMPIDRSNQVDLTRLHRLVTKKTLIEPPPPAAPAGPIQAPAVTGVTTAEGRDTLLSGSNQGRMPELRGNTVPFLALLRDVYVLSAAQAQPGSANPPK